MSRTIRLFSVILPARFSWAVWVCLFLLIQGFAGAAVGQDAPKDPDVEFRWAFAAATTPGGDEPVPVTRDTVLKSGDRLKMMVELRKRCFVYVFHHNPRDGLKLLFPYTLAQFDADYRHDRKYYIPRGEGWFKLDNNPGCESFYLVASAKRLVDIEKDYLRCESGNPAERAEAARAVLERIRALRKEHREFTSPAERPVPIGGAVREITPGEGPKKVDIASFADEIASTGFIARTYTIEHK